MKFDPNKSKTCAREKMQEFNLAKSGIALRGIKEAHSLNCPDCGKARYSATSDSEFTPDGRCWLSDGDTIFGLYRRLFLAGYVPHVDSSSPANWDKQNYHYQLMIGDCGDCNSEFYVIVLGLVDPGVEVTAEFFDAYFLHNSSIPGPEFYVANFEPKNLEWLVAIHDTLNGFVMEHTFGPFGLDGRSMKGQYGVASCSGDGAIWDHAQQFLFDLWPSLVKASVNINYSDLSLDQAIEL